MLGEEVVEEWLNRKGYFTIRGARVGNYEIDILAIRPLAKGGHARRHIEVQISINPISYLTKLPSAYRKRTGRAPHNAKKRSATLLRRGVREWVKDKFCNPQKVKLRRRLCRGAWTRELVVGRIKHEEELPMLKAAGVKIHRLKDILREMSEKPDVVRSAAGADLYDLMQLRE